MANILRVFLLLMLMQLEGKDFGKHGHVYPISEDNLLEYLQTRLHTLPEDDVQDVLRKYCQQQVGASFEEAKEYHRYEFDPSITVFQDVLDHNGTIIIPKGALVNPLEICSLSRELLFLDGDNPLHVQWAKKTGKEAKWILVKGKPLELEEQEELPIYFDQFGFLIRKLGIQQIPAKVSQMQGSLRLTIEEIPI